MRAGLVAIGVVALLASDAGARRVPVRTPAVAAKITIARVAARPPTLRRTARQLKRFSTVVIDARNMLGGNGDVGVAYLTALDMVTRLRHGGELTLLADKDALRVLGALTGGPVRPGALIHDGPGGRIRVHTARSLPAGFPSADLYLSLARPDDDPSHLAAQGRDRNGKAIGALVADHTIRIAYPWLSGGPAPDAAGTLAVGDRRATVSRPGLGRDEAGVYRDPVADALRGASPKTVRRTLLTAIGRIRHRRARAALGDLVAGRALRGARTGLVYGISAAPGARQFIGYLRGLVAEGQSTVLVTPSGFDPARLPARLRDHVVHLKLSRGDSLPAAAEPGLVYVVETPTLPHEVFVGMMAVSEVPVLVAGDGALSAAIGLGAPFAMTFVGHNRSAILGVGERLRAAASRPEQLELIERLFGTSAVNGAPDLAAAQALLRPENRALFAALAAEVGSLTDRVIETASAVRRKSGVELVR